MDKSSKKRITVKIKSPNPLFERWLTEWRDKAAENNSKMQYTFNIALKSLRKYPIPLNNGKECLILKGFGQKLCDMLDNKLRTYKESQKNIDATIDYDYEEEPTSKREKKPKKTKKSPKKTQNSDSEPKSDSDVSVPQISTECQKNTMDEDPMSSKEEKKSKKSPKGVQNIETKINGVNFDQNGTEITQNISPRKNSNSKTLKKSPKGYVPAYRSGSYAILLALLKMSEDPKFQESPTKAEIISVARDFCDTHFTKPDLGSGSYYTAWSSMSTLINKKLVEKKGNPPKFNLTAEGFECAFKLLDIQQEKEKNGDDLVLKRCHNDFNEKSVQNSEISAKKVRKTNPEKIDCDNFEPTLNALKNSNENFSTLSEPNEFSSVADQSVPSPRLSQKSENFSQKSDNPTLLTQKNQNLTQRSQNSSQKSDTQSQTETFIFAAGTFDIILLVDTQETEGKKVTELDDDTKYELNRSKIKYEIRHLKVGDFTWICRERNTNNELVLPFIVERKRLDDLSRSITDGRFHEQKGRLKCCGIKNLIYVIEKINSRQKLNGTDKIGALPMTTLEQAAVNTLVQDGFQVKYTNNHRHTMAYLATFSRFLIKYYSEKTVMSTSKENLNPELDLSEDLLPLLTFKDFNKSSSKQKDLTVREMFIKMLLQLKGVSVDKAIAITNVFATPRLLMDEYERMDKKFAPMLLAKISYGPFKRQIGAVISKTLYQFYTQDKLL